VAARCFACRLLYRLHLGPLPCRRCSHDV